MEWILVSSNFQALLFLQGKLLESVGKPWIPVKSLKIAGLALSRINSVIVSSRTVMPRDVPENVRALLSFQLSHRHLLNISHRDLLKHKIRFVFSQRESAGTARPTRSVGPGANIEKWSKALCRGPLRISATIWFNAQSLLSLVPDDLDYLFWSVSRQSGNW